VECDALIPPDYPALELAAAFLARGGPALWAIAALSVLTLGLVMWKILRLLRLGAWRKGGLDVALALWSAGRDREALAALARARGVRARTLRAAMRLRHEGRLSEATQREEIGRIARGELARARSGLRALEVIAAIAPLIGLLGTVLGMIEAFQALEATGNRADPSALAGGIWEALLTTAAGMAVAIPAATALAWFESVVERLQGQMEDAATRVFTRAGGGAR